MDTQLTRLEEMKRDTVFVEECLGAHMLTLMLEQASRERKLEIRSDFATNLKTASVVPLASLDEMSISRIARKTDEAAIALLRDLKKLDYLDGVYATAMFNLKLVEQNLEPDPQRMSVLMSLMLLEDVKNTDEDTEGAGPLMDVREIAWRDAANDTILRAQLMGLYLPETVALRAGMLRRKAAAVASKREQLVNEKSEKPRRAAGNGSHLRDKGNC